MPTAVITGASRGLGLALSRALARRGWALVLDARDARALNDAQVGLTSLGAVVHTVPGDVAEPDHRRALATRAAELGGAVLLVNNASTLGPSPRPDLVDYPAEALERVFRVNVVAPLALTQLLLPQLLATNRGTLLNITSDAAVEAYPGWGGYGSAKAALDQLTAVWAAEQPGLRVYAVDPGDMHTRMQQEAFPDEDISDRPDPDTVVPGLLALIEGDLPSGRYQARALAEVPA